MASVISLGVAGVALLGLTAWQVGVASNLRRDNAELHHKLDDKRATELVTARLACSDRAQRYFSTLGYSESQAQDGTFTSFENHFSQSLGRCLMTLDSSTFKNGQVTTKTLLDADEHKIFGDYALVWNKAMQLSEQRPMTCMISPPDKPEIRCHTTEEYDAYVKGMLSS